MHSTANGSQECIAKRSARLQGRKGQRDQRVNDARRVAEVVDCRSPGKPGNGFLLKAERRAFTTKRGEEADPRFCRSLIAPLRTRATTLYSSRIWDRLETLTSTRHEQASGRRWVLPAAEFVVSVAGKKESEDSIKKPGSPHRCKRRSILSASPTVRRSPATTAPQLSVVRSPCRPPRRSLREWKRYCRPGSPEGESDLADPPHRCLRE